MDFFISIKKGLRLDFWWGSISLRATQMVLMVKNSRLLMQKMLRDMDSTLDLEDLLEEGMQTILVFLENTVSLRIPWTEVIIQSKGLQKRVDTTEAI